MQITNEAMERLKYLQWSHGPSNPRKPTRLGLPDGDVQLAISRTLSAKLPIVGVKVPIQAGLNGAYWSRL